MAPNTEIVEVKGDLFSCPETHSLAHCISADVVMGKGIALLFKQRFGGVDVLRAQRKQTGEVAVLQPSPGGRFVYYLVTKPRWMNKPTYEDLSSSLMAMRAHCTKNNVKHVAMPRIGCGLDGLDWTKVKSLISNIFCHEACAVESVTIYYV
jgi:O-acetyl-ADP-ribose deacetylase (regulator of RNase III)